MTEEQSVPASNLPAEPGEIETMGVREGMFVLLLHPLGIPNGQAIGIGLLWYLTMLLVSLLGAPAFAFLRVAAHALGTTHPPADPRLLRVRLSACGRATPSAVARLIQEMLSSGVPGGPGLGLCL